MTRDRVPDALADTLQLRSQHRGSAPLEIPAGTRVDEYDVLGLRAKGGFSSVYRAVERESGRPVALKVLHPFLAFNPNALKRFQLELRALEGVAHPNVAAIYGHGEVAPGHPYLAIEWLDGLTVAEALEERGAFSTAESLTLLSDLGAALAAIHESGIVHRDLKASNVILVPGEPREVAMLVDFGIAKHLQDEQSAATPVTATGELVGTPNYMSPEQILFQPIDLRADIYSLGVLLFEMMTGRLPFEGDNAVELRDLHLRAKPPATSDLAAVPLAVDAVIQRCLRKRRSERFASVEELLRALSLAVSTGTSTGTAPADDDRSAVAVHVDVTVTGDDSDLDDRVLDEVDRQITTAAEMCVGLGLEVALQTGTAILAIDFLPAAKGEALKRRRHVLRGAIEMARALRALPGSGRVLSAVTVHCGPAPAQVAEERRSTPCELLRPERWASPTPPASVTATHAALVGLETELGGSPLPGATDRLEITGSVE